MNPLSISRCFRLYFLQRLICSFAGKTEAHYLPVMGLTLFIPPASLHPCIKPNRLPKRSQRSPQSFAEAYRSNARNEQQKRGSAKAAVADFGTYTLN